MQTIDHLVHAPWIITSDTQRFLLENHAIAVNNGKIIDILPTTQANQLYSAKKTEHFNTHAIMPGFINSHTHLAMNYFRGLADDLSLMNWLNHHIWPAEREWVSHEFVRDASLFAMAEMIRSGTTAFNDMYFFLQATAEATQQAGMRGFIGTTLIDFPTAWAKDMDEYFAKAITFIEEYKNHPLVTPTLAPHAIYTVPEKHLARALEIAEQYDLKINMHVQETADEVNLSINEFGLRPLKRLDNIGLISPRLIAVHMTQVDEEDFSILQNKQPHVVHCPESNMKLASGVCPVEKMRKLGINLALGTDGAASNNDLDMITEMRSAAFLAKLATHNPESLSAREAILMATIHGAKALGIDHLTGSLAKNKSADFIAINLDEIETQPLYHPESQIVYAGSRHQVTDVWVNGKQLLKNRQLITLDEGELLSKAKTWRQKIKKNA